MPGALFRRLVHGTTAGIFGQAVTIAGQLVSVPLLLALWGPRIYGDWLLLTAAPVLLSFLDLGLVQSTSNRMTTLTAAGEHAESRRTYDLAWSGLLVLAAILGTLAAVGVWSGDVRTLLGIHDLGDGQSRVILLAGVVWVLVGFQMGAMLCPLRAHGLHVEGLWWYHSMRCGELACSLAAAALGGGPVGAMLALLACRSAIGLALLWRSWSVAGHLPRWRRPSPPEIAPLVPPSLAAVGMAAAQAVSLQGTLVIIGHHLDTTACAQYATLRTLTRLPLQALGAVLLPMQSEMAGLHGRKDAGTLRRLWRLSAILSLGLAVSAGLGLLLFGPALYAAWTHGALPWNQPLVVLLVLAAGFSCLWNALIVPSLAANAHLRLALTYLALALGGAATLAIVMPLHPQLTTPAIITLAVDLLLVPIVFRHTQRHLAT